jgi:hypothetical protein
MSFLHIWEKRKTHSKYNNSFTASMRTRKEDLTKYRLRKALFKGRDIQIQNRNTEKLNNSKKFGEIEYDVYPLSFSQNEEDTKVVTFCSSDVNLYIDKNRRSESATLRRTTTNTLTRSTDNVRPLTRSRMREIEEEEKLELENEMKTEELKQTSPPRKRPHTSASFSTPLPPPSKRFSSPPLISQDPERFFHTLTAETKRFVNSAKFKRSISPLRPSNLVKCDLTKAFSSEDIEGKSSENRAYGVISEEVDNLLFASPDRVGISAAKSTDNLLTWHSFVASSKVNEQSDVTAQEKTTAAKLEKSEKLPDKLSDVIPIQERRKSLIPMLDETKAETKEVLSPRSELKKLDVVLPSPRKAILTPSEERPQLSANVQKKIDPPITTPTQQQKTEPQKQAPSAMSRSRSSTYKSPLITSAPPVLSPLKLPNKIGMELLLDDNAPMQSDQMGHIGAQITEMARAESELSTVLDKKDVRKLIMNKSAIREKATLPKLSYFDIRNVEEELKNGKIPPTKLAALKPTVQPEVQRVEHETSQTPTADSPMDSPMKSGERRRLKDIPKSTVGLLAQKLLQSPNTPITTTTTTLSPGGKTATVFTFTLLAEWETKHKNNAFLNKESNRLALERTELILMQLAARQKELQESMQQTYNIFTTKVDTPTETNAQANAATPVTPSSAKDLSMYDLRMKFRNTVQMARTSARLIRMWGLDGRTAL